MLQQPHPSSTRRHWLGRTGAAALGALVGWRLPAGTPLVWAGPLGSGKAEAAPERRGATSAASEKRGVISAGHPTAEITPVDRLYVQSWNRTPAFDTSRWRLEVAGEVERPLVLGAADLAARTPVVRQLFTLICIGNVVSGPQIGNVEWTGVRLADILAEARPRPTAQKLLLTAADRFTQTLTMDLARDPATLVAFGMNGGPLTADHGHPARLIVPGRYGVKSVKWVTRIEAVAGDVLGYWEQQGWDDAAVVRTTSRVDTPTFFQRVARSPVLVAGVAYAGRRGIASVEVSTDGTKSWQPAALCPARSPFSWSLWTFEWRPARAGEHVLAVRATDALGGRQATTRERAFPKGAGGLHEVIVYVLESALT